MLEPKRIVTFNTITAYMSELIKFGQTLPNSNKGMTKSEIKANLNVNEDLLNNLTDSQLVRSELLTGYGYVGPIVDAARISDAPNSNILIGGYFDYGGNIKNILVLDSNLNILSEYTGLHERTGLSMVSKIERQPVTGLMLVYGVRNNIYGTYRLNSSLEIDTTFTPIEGWVYGLPDGSLVGFTLAGSYKLKKYHINGEVDNSWTGNSQTYVFPEVIAVTGNILHIHSTSSYIINSVTYYISRIYTIDGLTGNPTLQSEDTVTVQGDSIAIVALNPITGQYLKITQNQNNGYGASSSQIVVFRPDGKYYFYRYGGSSKDAILLNQIEPAQSIETLIDYRIDYSRLYFINGRLIGCVGSRLEYLTDINGNIYTNIPSKRINVFSDLYVSNNQFQDFVFKITSGATVINLNSAGQKRAGFNAGQPITVTFSYIGGARRKILSIYTDTPYNDLIVTLDDTNTINYTFTPTRNITITAYDIL